MKKYIFIALIMAMVALAGCATGSKDTPSTSPYLGGSQGLVAQFESIGVAEGNVATIFNDETFSVETTLKNKGEEDVEQGAIKLKIKGINPADFDGLTFEKTNSNKLEKTSSSNPSGGEETVNFGNGKYKQDLAGTFIPFTIIVTYIYPYKTHVSVPKVCFKESLKEKGVCDVEGVKEAFSSGAPIRVTSVKETRAGAGVIRLEYQLENVGGGDASKLGVEFDNRYSTVAFALDPSADPDKWECSGNNEVRLQDGKATIWCKLKSPMEAGTSYTKPIDLTISYDYKSSVLQDIKIKSSSS